MEKVAEASRDTEEDDAKRHTETKCQRGMRAKLKSKQARRQLLRFYYLIWCCLILCGFVFELFLWECLEHVLFVLVIQNWIFRVTSRWLVTFRVLIFLNEWITILVPTYDNESYLYLCIVATTKTYIHPHRKHWNHFPCEIMITITIISLWCSKTKWILRFDERRIFHGVVVVVVEVEVEAQKEKGVGTFWQPNTIEERLALSLYPHTYAVLNSG